MRSRSENAVKTTTLTSGSAARIRRVASMPSRSGISRSIRTTSGRAEPARAVASTPPAAAPTTSTCSRSSSSCRRPARTTGWSSATKRSFSKSRIRLSPLMVLIKSAGPVPGEKARRNALITPAGFFRSSTLRKSKLKRKVKRSGNPRSRRERDASVMGLTIGR